MEIKQKPTIVFVQTAFIGDLFLSLPTINRLRQLYPDFHLILVCKKGLSEYFVQKGFVDHAIEVEKGDGSSYQNAIKVLNTMNIHFVFCVHKSLRSALFVRSLKAHKKIGFKRFLSFLFFTHTASYLKKYPDVIRQLNILSPVDADVARDVQLKDWSYLNFKQESNGLFPSIPDFFSFGKKSQPSRKMKVGIFPGSVWATKKWTVEGFSQVTAHLITKGYQVFLMGAPAEKDVCQQIHQANPQAVDLSGQLKLADSIEQIQNFDFIVCNDSAPAHMAASQQIPSLVIFGPTTLNLGFRPWLDQSIVVENENLNCRPCGAHGPKVCPLGHHNCMKTVTADQVIQALDLLMD